VLTFDGQPEDGFAFYRKDYVVDLPLNGGAEEGIRANFVRGPDGTVQWFRLGGRLARRVTPDATRGGRRATTFNPRSLLS
jgi:hypothetical protein